MIMFRVLLCLPFLLLPSSTFGFQSAKPLASTVAITEKTPGHAVMIEADIKGAKNLYLVVRDGDNGYGGDWADWAEPRLVGSKGELKLTDVKWKSAASDWGNVGVNRNVDGGSLRINGKAVEYGIGTHANSVIHFELPEGYENLSRELVWTMAALIREWAPVCNFTFIHKPHPLPPVLPPPIARQKVRWPVWMSPTEWN